MRGQLSACLLWLLGLLILYPLSLDPSDQLLVSSTRLLIFSLHPADLRDLAERLLLLILATELLLTLTVAGQETRHGHCAGQGLLLLGLHHAGGQEIVQVKESSVFVVHVAPEPRLVPILVDDQASAQQTTHSSGDCVVHDMTISEISCRSESSYIC